MSVFLNFIITYWLQILFGAILSGLSLIMKRFDAKLKKMQATEHGVQALLRNEIIQTYNKAKECGYLAIYERENVQHLYDEYKSLGGNGVVKDLVDKIFVLPTDKNEA